MDTSPRHFSRSSSAHRIPLWPATKLTAAMLSASTLLLASCSTGDEGVEASFNPPTSGGASSADAVASSSGKAAEETGTSAADGQDGDSDATSQCAGRTLETSGLHADKIPSYTTYPYSYKIEDNGYDACAELSFVHLKGVFAADGDQGAWESPTSTVIYFHRGEIIKNPAPEMYFRVENPRQVDESTVTFDLKAPGAEYYMPFEDAGSATATFDGGGLTVDESGMNQKDASDMRIDLS